MFHHNPGGMSEAVAAHFKEPSCTNIHKAYKDSDDLALPSTRRLENARPGAAAHMSLHLSNNVKEPTKIDASGFPLLEGDRCARFSVTVEANRVAHCVGGGHIWGRFFPVNSQIQLFRIFLPRRETFLPAGRAAAPGMSRPSVEQAGDRTLVRDAADRLGQ